MTLPKETIKATEKEISEKEQAQCTEFTKGYKIGFKLGVEAGATEWAANAQGLLNLLDEARLQIEYLHKKFGETGSGNNVLARIETALAKYKEVTNG
jgi:hypothetical protein